MKTLWSIIALLLFGTAAVVLIRSPASPRPLSGRPPAAATPAAIPETRPDAPPASSPATAPAPDAVPASVDAAPTTPASTQAPAPSSPAAPTEPATPATPATPAAPTASAPSEPVLADLANVQIPGLDQHEPVAKPEGDAVAIPDDPAFPAARLIPAKAARNPDGTLRLDDRFTLKGSGTKLDPYRVPWDLLASAQENYKPRMGQTRLPQRVTLLNGKYVELSGYVAFPITAASPKEMLVMLNQWDGCCIGVPPTAYDAVEVKLNDAATPQQRFLTRGGVRGRFKVDPYEDGGWLLGLYVLEDASLVVNSGE